jgi:hypothetical protein
VSIAVCSVNHRETAVEATGKEVRSNAVFMLRCATTCSRLSRKQASFSSSLVINKRSFGQNKCWLRCRKRELVKRKPFSDGRGIRIIRPRGGTGLSRFNDLVTAKKFKEGCLLSSFSHRSMKLLAPVCLRRVVDLSTWFACGYINKRLEERHTLLILLTRILRFGRTSSLEKKKLASIGVLARRVGSPSVVSTGRSVPFIRRLGARASGCLREGSESSRTLTTGFDNPRLVDPSRLDESREDATLTGSNNLHSGLI